MGRGVGARTLHLLRPEVRRCERSGSRGSTGYGSGPSGYGVRQPDQSAGKERCAHGGTGYVGTRGVVVTDLEEGGWVRVMVMVAGRGAPARHQAPAAPLPRHKVGHGIGIMGLIS